MKKDTIVQFVCFVTNLEFDEFLPKWEFYAKRLMNNKTETNLQQQIATSKNKFRYISQHEWPDFHFTFMNKKQSEHFPEQKVKVVQAGGYIPLQHKKRQTEDDNEMMIVAFLGHNENDLDFYKKLPSARQLNIFQAYYESCTYGYVLEFFVAENDADELLFQLKQRIGVESGIYRECLVPQI